MKRNYNIFQNQIPIILKALHKAKRISVDLIVKCVKGYRGKKKKESKLMRKCVFPYS